MAKCCEIYNPYTVSTQADLDFWQLLCDERLDTFFKVEEENTRVLKNREYRYWIIETEIV